MQLAVNRDALVIDADTGEEQVRRVICSVDTLLGGKDGRIDNEATAYAQVKKLRACAYGSIWVCVVLRRHGEFPSDKGSRKSSVSSQTEWETTTTIVALKKIKLTKVPILRKVEDPIKEVAAMQFVGDRPHVLHSLEAMQDKKYIYSFVPYCVDNLMGYVSRCEKLNQHRTGIPENKARHWFVQLVMSLQSLQSCGVCHRDLSLENVLLHEGSCLVMDFGMCLRVPHTEKEWTESTLRRLIRPQGASGKPFYIAPEVLVNEESFDGFSVDIWAAGVMLFVLLTGAQPFELPSSCDPRYMLIANGKLVELLEAWGMRLSSQAADLVQNMLQPDPRKRFSLAQVMSHEWVSYGWVR